MRCYSGHLVVKSAVVTMFYKAKKIFSRFLFGKFTSKKRQRNPTSFQECIERSEKSRDIWKTVFLILLLLATIYYMFYNRNIDSSPDIEPFDERLIANEQNEGTDHGEIIITHKKIEENDTTLLVEPKTKRPKRTYFAPRDGQPLCASITVTEGKNDTNSSTAPKFPKTVNSIDNKAAMDMGIMMGGHYIPKDCKPKHRVAILVPYRNRVNNLNVFLYYMHPFLIRQNLEYRIFVIEQFGIGLFNKGRLFNAGFLEIQKSDEWQCVILHDIDLLPADDRIRYTCPVLPRHMCARVLGKEHIAKYNTMFSGVIAMTMWHFKKANGYSNLYTEKGESADMFKRLQAAGLGVTRYKKNIAKYFSIKHPYRAENHKMRDTLLASAIARYKRDGLNSLRYSIVSYASKPLYTHIVVDVNVQKLPNYITEASVTLSP